MIPKKCKRLAEVDFPLAAVEKQSHAANRRTELMARRERRTRELQHYWLNVSHFGGMK